MSRITVIRKAAEAGFKTIAKAGKPKSVENAKSIFTLHTDFGDVFVHSTEEKIAQIGEALLNDKTVKNIIKQQNTGTPRDVSQHDVRRILSIMGYGSKPVSQKGDHYKFKQSGWPIFIYSGTKKGVDPNTIEQLENFFRDIFGLLPKK